MKTTRKLAGVAALAVLIGAVAVGCSSDDSNKSSSSTTTSKDSRKSFQVSTPDGQAVNNSTSAGAGSAFVGTVEFSGAYTGNTVVVSNEGTTYVIVSLESGGAGSTSST